MEQYYISDNIKKQLIYLISTFDKLAKKYNLEYWIDGGTILGAIRHKNFIPWDDDLDVSILNSSLSKLKHIFTHLKNYNLEFTKTFYGYKIFFKDGKKIKRNLWREHKIKFKKKNPSVKGRALISKGASKTYKRSKKILYEKYTYPFLDIFITKEKNKQIVYKNDWHKCRYTTNEVFPLKKYKFGKLRLPGPNNPINYFNGCYGKDWKEYGLISYDHKNEKIIKPIKFKLI